MIISYFSYGNFEVYCDYSYATFGSELLFRALRFVFRRALCLVGMIPFSKNLKLLFHRKGSKKLIRKVWKKVRKSAKKCRKNVFFKLHGFYTLSGGEKVRDTKALHVFSTPEKG